MVEDAAVLSINESMKKLEKNISILSTITTLAPFLGLLGTGTELEGDVAVLVLGALRDDLTAFEAEHGHRYVCASFIEEAGHTEFLGKYAGSHRINPLRA